MDTEQRRAGRGKIRTLLIDALPQKANASLPERQRVADVIGAVCDELFGAADNLERIASGVATMTPPLTRIATALERIADALTSEDGRGAGVLDRIARQLDKLDALRGDQ